MSTSLRWTIADLEALPDDDKRYEIIDGELYVSTAPGWDHQLVAATICGALNAWGRQAGRGMANTAPGVIFADDDSAIPDVVWVSAERLPLLLQEDGKLHGAPDMAIEVLSPGQKHERRDREAKLRLYSRRGVREYWIVNWQQRQVEVYRRQEAALRLVGTLLADDRVQTPLLPGFEASVRSFFEGNA